MPEILYHYTSQQGLTGIVADKVIWATNLHYLNDETEYKYPLDLLTKKLRSRIDTSGKISIPMQALYSVFNQEEKYKNKDDGSLDSLKRMNDFLTLSSRVPIYICSFSEKKDHLGQWRGYSLNGASFSMGFDFFQLRTLAANQGFSLEKCIYDPEEQEEIIKKFIDELPQEFKTKEDSEKLKIEDEISIFVKFLNKFWRLAPTIKHDSFRDEQEWRLISGAVGTGKGTTQFRIGKSMIIPYLNFSLGDNLPLKEIYVGPTPHMDLSVNSVKTYLLSKNLKKIHVSPSSVPYRSW